MPGYNQHFFNLHMYYIYSIWKPQNIKFRVGNDCFATLQNKCHEICIYQKSKQITIQYIFTYLLPKFSQVCHLLIDNIPQSPLFEGFLQILTLKQLTLCTGLNWKKYIQMKKNIFTFHIEKKKLTQLVVSLNCTYFRIFSDCEN